MFWQELIPELLKQGASELRLTVGLSPLLRVQGKTQELETKILEPADTIGLMKSITPERCQQEFYESEKTEFEFAYGKLARLQIFAYRERGNVALVLRQVPDAEGAAEHGDA